MAYRKVNVAIVGLGRVGSFLLKKFLEKQSAGITTLVVSEKVETEGTTLAKQRGIKVVSEPVDVLQFGEQLDLILELTGLPHVRKMLEENLAKAGNKHTIIVPQEVSFLIWDLLV